MIYEYERAAFTISAFHSDDVITTSAPVAPTEPTTLLEKETDNAFGTYGSFSKAPGSWF